MTSAFDPNSFLDAQISAPMVRRPNIPAGTEVIGSVVEVTPRQWTSKDDPSKTGMAMDLQIDLDLTTVPGLAEKIGQTKVRVKDGIMLDLTDNGAIDVGAGKNGKLRRYREALDMNKPGDTFSFRGMIGRQLRCRIALEDYKGETYENVAAIARP